MTGNRSTDTIQSTVLFAKSILSASNEEKMNYYDCIDNEYNCIKTCPCQAKC